MDKKALVSVIVPIYNTERYLRDCLDSIAYQTYDNLEIILVDDGSNDDSGRICDEFALGDSRFVVIHLENDGVANARNKGIDASHGQYLMFVDADDLISPKMVETLVSIHTQEVDCISCCDMVEFHPGEEVVFSEEISSVVSYDNATFIRSMYLLPRKIAYASTVTVKLFPKELIGERRFKKIICEDNVFNAEVIINHCRQIIFSDAKLYAYRRHDDSTMGQLEKIGNKKYIDRCYALYTILQILPPDNTYARGLNLSYLHFRLVHSRYLVKQYYTDKSEEYCYAQHVLKDLGKKTFKEFMTNKYIPFRKKIAYLLYESFPKFYTLKLLIDYRLLHKWS